MSLAMNSLSGTQTQIIGEMRGRSRDRPALPDLQALPEPLDLRVRPEPPGWPELLDLQAPLDLPGPLDLRVPLVLLAPPASLAQPASPARPVLPDLPVLASLDL